ncbi:MAG TPA: TlpA family protein disulfide reductase [Chitinophagaceae bacterium]|nr:TlpA family protein disulfide reductase [Chitinophagaceae bacterium]
MKSAGRLIAMIGLMLLGTAAGAQDERLRKLNIGDTVPDISLANLVNYKTSSAKLSDFKGKLLILDFWATWCGPCIAAFPRLDSLQKKYGDKMQVIPVTSEAKQLVSDFLERMNKMKKVSVFSVVNDKTLGKLFPHTYLPHYVWIDAGGKVVAITEMQHVNEANINAVLSGKGLQMAEKKDKAIRLAQPKRSMFNSIKIRDGKDTVYMSMPDADLILQSSLTRFIDGLPPVTETKDTIIRMINAPVYWLFRYALWKGGSEVISSANTIIDIKDSMLVKKLNSAATGREYLMWLKDYGYCYEMKVPSIMQREKFNIAVEELNRYFGIVYGIEGVMEKRSRKYLALVRTTGEDKLATKGGPVQVRQDKIGLKIQNAGLSNLMMGLAVPFQSRPPLIDETEYKGKVDIELNCQLSNLQALNKELEKYGLAIIEKEKLMDIAVIRKKDTAKNLSRND